MSTNFRLELRESPAREVEDQQYFLAPTLFRGSLGLSHVLFSSSRQNMNTSLSDDSLSSRRKLFDTLYIRSVSKSFLNRITYRELKKYWNLFVYIQTKSCRNMALKLNSEGTKSKCSKLVQRLTQDFKKGGVGAKLSKKNFRFPCETSSFSPFRPPPPYWTKLNGKYFTHSHF